MIITRELQRLAGRDEAINASLLDYPYVGKRCLGSELLAIVSRQEEHTTLYSMGVLKMVGIVHGGTWLISFGRWHWAACGIMRMGWRYATGKFGAP